MKQELSEADEVAAWIEQDFENEGLVSLGEVDSNGIIKSLDLG